MEALQQIPWGMEFSATPPFHGVPCDARALVVSVVSVFREDLWWLLGIRDSDFFCFWFYTLQVCFFNIPRFGVRGAFYFESPLGAFQWLFWSMSFQGFVELWHRAFGWVAPFRSWRIWRSRRSIPLSEKMASPECVRVTGWQEILGAGFKWGRLPTQIIFLRWSGSTTNFIDSRCRNPVQIMGHVWITRCLQLQFPDRFSCCWWFANLVN